MSKIIRAANAMLSNPEKITSVIPTGKTYYFLYDGKHKWSMNYVERGDEYNLLFFPGNGDLKKIASMNDDEWQYFDEFVAYSTSDLNSREARETFSELYLMLKEKVFGIDKVLDEIINEKQAEDDLPF